MGKGPACFGREILIDIDGMRHLYKDDTTGKHILSAENLLPMRAKRLRPAICRVSQFPMVPQVAPSGQPTQYQRARRRKVGPVEMAREYQAGRCKQKRLFRSQAMRSANRAMPRAGIMPFPSTMHAQGPIPAHLCAVPNGLAPRLARTAGRILRRPLGGPPLGLQSTFLRPMISTRLRHGSASMLAA